MRCLFRAKSNKAIFAFGMDRGMACDARVQFKAKPSTNSLSKADFPCAFRMLMALVGYVILPLGRSVRTLETASTHIFAKKSHSVPMILELMEVRAAFNKFSFPRVSAFTTRFLLMNFTA